MPSNITLEDIFNGRREIRNRVIANILKELGLIEQWGSGINRIINSCKEYGLASPKIEEQNDFMDIEIIRSQEDLPTKKTENERKRTIANDCGRLTLGKQKILLYLLDHQTINRSTASPLIQAKSSKTSEILAQFLKDDQLIDKKGKGRATYYTLKQNDN